MSNPFPATLPPALHPLVNEEGQVQVAWQQFLVALRTWVAKFESEAEALPAAGASTSFVHGLSAPPKLIQAWLTCTATDIGWAEGDVVQAQGAALWADTSAIWVLVPSTGLALPDKSTGTLTAIDPTKWTLLVRGWL